MFFAKPHYDRVVQIIAEKRIITAKDLHKELLLLGSNISLVHVYNIIKELLSLHIIIKTKKNLSINNWRLDRIKQFAKEASETDAKENNTNILMLEENESTDITAPTLSVLDSVRTDIYSQLLAKEDPSELFFFTSHAYHILGLPSSEHEFLSWGSENRRIYYVIGNNTFLDNYAASLLRSKGIKGARTYEQSSFLDSGYLVDIIGDYIIELLLPPTLSEYFDQYFQHTNSISDFDPEFFSSLFSMKSNPKLRIIRSKVRSEVLKQKFKDIIKK